MSFFDIKEINRHNKEDSCWIICNKKVYDITELIEKHPGGKSCLLKKGGGNIDCLKDYNFHSKKGKKEWEKYFIGNIKNVRERKRCIIM